MTNLNENLDVFEDEETEETTIAEVEQKPETKVVETKESESKGETKETPTGETEEAVPPAAEEEKLVPIAALHDERRKAKLLKEDLEQYKSKYDQDDNEPDPAEDPEAFKQYVRAKAKRDMIQESRTTSREKILETHQDYVEKEDIFLVLAGSNPKLLTEMDESGNPAKFAYEKGKEWEDNQREKLTAQILAAAKNDDVIEGPSASELRNKSAVGMPDLTKATATGSNNEPSEIDNRDNLGSVFD